jgi:hypothetical protein
MRKRWLAVVMCLVIGATFAVSLGCTPQRRAIANASVNNDVNQLQDDLQWIVGLDEPSILYEDTVPPYQVHPR